MNEEKILLIDETMIEDGQMVVLGLSGGPDSVCLLYELRALDAKRKSMGEAGHPIICAHVNHGVRGDEAIRDEVFVASLCEQMELPFELKRINAAEMAKEEGITLEEAGRIARYAFFDEICEKYEVPTDVGSAQTENRKPVIAVAHNRDDQIETVFMRMVRGTGIDGLSGIAARRESAAGYDIVRPLLGVSRKDIEKRLDDIGANVCEDSSNFETEYFRNKIRNEILPYIEKKLEINFGKSILRLAENASEDKAYFEFIVNEALAAHMEIAESEGDKTAYLPMSLLSEMHLAVRHRVIRRVFSETGLMRDIAAVHLASADHLIEKWKNGGEASGKRVEFPLDYTFGISGKMAVFRPPGHVENHWKERRKR